MSDIATDSVAESSVPEVEEVDNDQPLTEDQSAESVIEEDDEEPEEGDEAEESEQDEDQPDAESSLDTVDVEYEGERYKLPPKLKDALMRDQDYTLKTQSHAETVRAYEAERADFQQYVEATTAQSTGMANLAALDQQLQSFQQYDWNAAFDADITSATKLQHQMQQFQSQREQIVGSIQQGESKRQEMRHENMVRTAQRTDEALAKEIPNWGDDRKTELGRFAVETLGFPATAVSQAVTKAEIKTLHYAEIGFKAEQRVRAAKKGAGKGKVKVAPSKSINPKRQSAPKSLSNVSDPSAYRELRMAQKRKSLKG